VCTRVYKKVLSISIIATKVKNATETSRSNRTPVNEQKLLHSERNFFTGKTTASTFASHRHAMRGYCTYPCKGFVECGNICFRDGIHDIPFVTAHIKMAMERTRVGRFKIASDQRVTFTNTT